VVEDPTQSALPLSSKGSDGLARRAYGILLQLEYDGWFLLPDCSKGGEVLLIVWSRLVLVRLSLHSSPIFRI